MPMLIMMLHCGTRESFDDLIPTGHCMARRDCMQTVPLYLRPQ